MESFEFKYRESENLWWDFQFNYSGKLEVLCINSAAKIHKILRIHKIHQAQTEVFLRRWESLWLLNSPEIGKKSLFRKDSPTKAEKKRIYYYENSTNTGKIIFK